MLSQAELLTGTMRSINKKALEPKSKTINWRHWILWIALITAALMLLWMAVGLMKKMSE
jgi:4-hydroxybenzoate polyprenyltransferase